MEATRYASGIQMNKIITIMIAILVGGCDLSDGNFNRTSYVEQSTWTGPAPLGSDLAIDDDFSSEEVAAILEAAASWEGATNGRARLSFHVRPVEFGEQMAIARVAYVPEGGETLAGWSSGINGQSVAIAVEVIGFGVRSSGATYEDFFKYVVAHELGHAIGVDHVDDMGVMRGGDVEAILAGVLEPQPCDVAAFDAAWPL